MVIMQLPAKTRSDTACKRLCSTLFNQTSQNFLSTKIFINITVFTVTTAQGKYEVIENITKYRMITLRGFLIWHWSWQAGGFLCSMMSWLNSSLVVLLHYFLNSVYSSSCINLYIFERFFPPHVYPFRMPGFLCFCVCSVPEQLHPVFRP